MIIKDLRQRLSTENQSEDLLFRFNDREQCGELYIKSTGALVMKLHGDGSESKPSQIQSKL